MSAIAAEEKSKLLEHIEKLQIEILELKKIEKEVLEIGQIAQKRLGLQLHDGICQKLMGISMFVKGLLQKNEQHNPLDSVELRQVYNLIQETVSDARDLAHGLYPGDLEGPTLTHALQKLMTETQSLSGVTCRLRYSEPVMIDDNNTATHIYKITQEGLSNAITHGKAQAIDVGLLREDGYITLTIADNGIGMSTGLINNKGIGLKIMKYRAQFMGASFEIKPNTPSGVVIRCIFNK